MPPLVAAAAISAGGILGSSVIGSRSASSAAKSQEKTAADALAFQKQQAAQDLVTANATQKANYDQWAARQQRLSNLSVLTGAGPFTIPDYVPIPQAGGMPTAPQRSTPNALIGGDGIQIPGTNGPPQSMPAGGYGNGGINDQSRSWPIDPSTGLRTPPTGAPAMGGSPFTTSMDAMVGARMPNQSGAQGNMVMLRAPNGQTKLVPQSMASQYISRGAQVMS